LKQRSTKEALALLPWLQEIIQKSPDPLEITLRLSTAGNIIDFGAAREFDLRATIQQVLTADFAIYDLQAIKQALANARTILFWQITPARPF